MKLTKKLLPALGMLALSACMLVTSTFAWFSMNTKVSATGMKVTAVTDQVFLQITKNGGTFNDGKIQDNVTADNNTAKYGAVNVYADGTGSPYDGGDAFSWLTASSFDPDVSDKETDYSTVTIGNYAYITAYDLRYDPTAGENATADKLRVEDVKLESGSDKAISKAVSVLVVNETDHLSMLWKQDDTGAFKLDGGSDDALTTNIFPAGGTVVTVKVYVFFDGDNTACTTTNAIAAKDVAFSVGVYFTVAS